jgi:peptidoglycan-associated lipoprotein
MLLALCGGLFPLSSVRMWAQQVERMELGAEYNFVDANAPPGRCGCFHMNGGAGWFAHYFSSSFALVGEVGAVHAGHVNGSASDFTLTSFLAGPRYSRHIVSRVSPFAEALLGGAHASGGLTPVASGLAGSANAFALGLGGGLDLELSRRWALRPLQLDYFLTRFNNGSNDHQNNLRVGVGMVYRFGGKG